MKKVTKNNISALLLYCREVGIADEIQAAYELQRIIEEYFEKSVYFDEKFEVHFVQNDKKVTISLNLTKHVIKGLRNFKLRYKNENALNPNLFVNKYVNATIISIQKNGFILVDKDDNNCFLPFSKTIKKFKIGDKDIFLCKSILRNNTLSLEFGIRVLQKKLNQATDNMFAIYVQKYVPNKTIIFSFSGEKLGKENISKIKQVFPAENLIYNKRN